MIRSPRAEALVIAARGLALAAAVALLAAPGALLAQKADRDQPIHLEADHVVLDDARQVATFTGNVVLTQGSTVIRGDRMEVRQDRKGFRQGITWGNLAYFRQRRAGTDELIEGWAERIEYDSRAERLQMFNRAMMKRGADEVRGHYISYDAKTEVYQVTGAGKPAAGTKPPEGRVRAILQPRSKEDSPSPAGGKIEPAREEPGVR
jgi:lipopolysaccharide export system protein LptA